MTPSTFESMRLIVIVIAVLLKLVLMPIYLQSYLNLANQRLEVQKKEAGRISNVEFQKKVIYSNINSNCDLKIYIFMRNISLDCSSFLLFMRCSVTVYCSSDNLFVLYSDV